MTSVRFFGAIAVLAGTAFGQAVTLPGGTLTLAATNAAGSSFVFTGPLTQAATLSLTAAGLACEQGAAYCTNAAGVVVIAGSSAIGQTSTFTGTFGPTTGSWNFGALLMTISGVGTVQLFPASSGNGLGSGSPPTSISFSGAALSGLGFPNFSVTNPTITFTVADNNYVDNSGTFVLTSAARAPSSTPVPPSIYLTLIGLSLAILMAKRSWHRV